ncbi:LysR family transcriptional regulator [Rheinheimera sp.]|jgi:DNA-binding transcriptional LysR family regulator|uniref:LysR family transcriptional regulator n=1 Tax=Rheinheimera sp. TaxID=1869214 RepID=UPI0026277356|nr:LysR family transcriptional regulator [Rheinheimera sp.]MCA1930434.1 LysR family transcriptional regulator [Rheinheimera sp.]
MDMLRAMTVFSRVVETGSFSAVARDLGLGQPAISKTVEALEQHLGVRLLLRSTRRLTITEAGQAFYENAAQVVALAEEAESAARGAAGLYGRLRISVPVTFGRLHLVPRLHLFMEQHPNLQIELLMDDRYIDLIAEKIDLSLRTGTLADSNLTARKLATAQRYVVASPGYLAKKGKPATPAELLEHDVIVYGQGSNAREWQFKQGTTQTSVHVQSRLQVSAAEGLREAVLSGMGLAIASGWMVGAELEKGELVRVLDDWTLPALDLWALHASGRMVSIKVRTFLNWLDSLEL